MLIDHGVYRKNCRFPGGPVYRPVHTINIHLIVDNRYPIEGKTGGVHWRAIVSLTPFAPIPLLLKSGKQIISYNL